jgi:hypothetical protein
VSGRGLFFNRHWSRTEENHEQLGDTPLVCLLLNHNALLTELVMMIIWVGWVYLAEDDVPWRIVTLRNKGPLN